MKTKLQFSRLLMLLMLTLCTFGAWAQTSQTTTQTVCIGSEPYLVDASPIAGATYVWSVSGGGLLTAGNGTRSVTINWTSPGGPYTVTVYTRANGCDGPPTTVAVTVTPAVTISAFLPATSTRCQGAGTETITTTATNSTGITYSLDAASLAGGNTINAVTGAVTYVAGWSGTTTITASAAGCNGPVTTTLTVTVYPTPTTSPIWHD